MRQRSRCGARLTARVLRPVVDSVEAVSQAEAQQESTARQAEGVVPAEAQA